MKKDEGLLSSVKLHFEELPLFKEKKASKTNEKERVLGNSMDTGSNNSGNNTPVHRTPSLFRLRSQPTVRYVNVNGKQVPIYSPRFFNH